MKRMWSKNELKKISQETQKDITTLVDKDGNPRFIEGDITIETIEGITQTYGKWSLSGSHLLIVIGVAIADTTAWTGNKKLAGIALPQWVIDKIQVLYSTSVVDQKNIPVYSNAFTSQVLLAYFEKQSATAVTVSMGAFSATANRYGRIAFDLLIDNE